MQTAGREIILGTFEKNNLLYFVVLAQEFDEDTNGLIPTGVYRGIFLHPRDKEISIFAISADDEGRWMPDKREKIDPWVADYIGSIIENKGFQFSQSS